MPEKEESRVLSRRFGYNPHLTITGFKLAPRDRPVMQLDQISYIQFRAEPAQWDVEGFTLGHINLIVGRNAVGKSRVLNIIAGLGNRFFKGKDELFHQGEYHVVFKKGQESWDYMFEFDNYEILKEILLYNGADVLQRGQGGVGQIEAYDVEGKKVRMKFKAPKSLLSVAAKRDSIQHPYLESLHEWAESLRHFQFGTEMRPNNLVVRVKNDQIKLSSTDDKDTNYLVPTLETALKTHGDAFKASVMEDMGALGYPITDLKIKRPDHIIVRELIPGDIVGVSVKETELPCLTDQTEMSQGMFRTLSLIIQITHYMMSNKSGCILVDDIGEGLDFERSCVLIDLIRAKAKQSSFQLVMTTNNRFVMNRVPLEEWCLLERKAGKVRVRNYANSAEAFERFKKTGLNNFDLLATDYLQGAQWKSSPSS